VNIYSVEETAIGNYFKINYLLARQLMTIFDIWKQRILDATTEEVKESITETTLHFENKVKYVYDEMPLGWIYFLQQQERPRDYKEFINWFFRHKQQPRDYLIHGSIKHRSEKRSPMQDNTAMSSEYGGIPLEIDNGKGYKPQGFTKRF